MHVSLCLCNTAVNYLLTLHYTSPQKTSTLREKPDHLNFIYLHYRIRLDISNNAKNLRFLKKRQPTPLIRHQIRIQRPQNKVQVVRSFAQGTFILWTSVIGQSPSHEYNKIISMCANLTTTGSRLHFTDGGHNKNKYNDL